MRPAAAPCQQACVFIIIKKKKQLENPVHVLELIKYTIR